jgi:AcrR family transcriptional regulator
MITRELILKIAGEQFLKFGEKSVTIERIAKELHTSKRTIYIHFKDKTDLVNACLKAYFAQVRDENEKIIDAAHNAIEAIGYINFNILKRAASENPNFFQDIHAYYPGLLRDAYRENGHFAHTHLKQLAEWGIKDKIFVADLDVDVTMKTVQALLELTRDTSLFPVGEYSKKLHWKITSQKLLFS